MNSTYAKSRAMFALVVASSLIFITGCASMPPKSGFLSDYSELKLLHDDAQMWNFVDKSGVARSRDILRLWVNRPDLDAIAGYDSVIVDPFVVRLNKNSAGNWVSPEKLSELTKAIQAAFVESVSSCYTIVEQPGDGVARFRTALTDISPLYAYKSAEDIAALTWANSRAGGGAFEMEFVDSVTKKQIAAVVGKYRGGSFDPLDSNIGRWDNVVEGAGDFGAFLCDRREAASASN